MAKSTALVAARDSQSPIDPDRTLKASRALLAHIQKSTADAAASAPSSKKNLLAPETPAADAPIWLSLTAKKLIHDTSRLKPGRIGVPHAFVNRENLAVCLIVADPQAAYKAMVYSEEFPAELKGLVSRVIDVTHLQKKFKTFEAQRQLFAEHDVFLGDDRIINRLPKLLGKTFYRSTTKRPIPVTFSPPRDRVDGKRIARTPNKPKRDPSTTPSAAPIPQIASEINKALSSAYVHLNPSPNTAVKVGHAAMTAAELADNVSVVSRELVERWVPGKWEGVRGIYLKGRETVALPIWETSELWLDGSKVVADEAGAVEEKVVEAKKSKKKMLALPGPETDAGLVRRKRRGGLSQQKVDGVEKVRPKKKAKVDA